jgi:hypothetical protein
MLFPFATRCLERHAHHGGSEESPECPRLCALLLSCAPPWRQLSSFATPLPRASAADSWERCGGGAAGSALRLCINSSLVSRSFKRSLSLLGLSSQRSAEMCRCSSGGRNERASERRSGASKTRKRMILGSEYSCATRLLVCGQRVSGRVRRSPGFLLAPIRPASCVSAGICQKRKMASSLEPEPSDCPEPEDGARLITLEGDARGLPRRREIPPRPAKALICRGCGISAHHVRRRICTGGEALCPACRSSPVHRVMSEALLRARAPWLDAIYFPCPVGYAVNCKHPAFRSQRMYLWSEVAERCVALGLDVPE